MIALQVVPALNFPLGLSVPLLPQELNLLMSQCRADFLKLCGACKTPGESCYILS